MLGCAKHWQCKSDGEWYARRRQNLEDKHCNFIQFTSSKPSLSFKACAPPSSHVMQRLNFDAAPLPPWVLPQWAQPLPWASQRSQSLRPERTPRAATLATYLSWHGGLPLVALEPIDAAWTHSNQPHPHGILADTSSTFCSFKLGSSCTYITASMVKFHCLDTLLLKQVRKKHRSSTWTNDLVTNLLTEEVVTLVVKPDAANAVLYAVRPRWECFWFYYYLLSSTMVLSMNSQPIQEPLDEAIDE